MSVEILPVTTPRPSTRRRWILVSILGVPMFLALCLGLFAAWSLRVGGDVARLRDRMTQHAGAGFEPKVGFRATWPALLAARGVVRAFNSEIPAEALAALESVRRVEVCVGEYSAPLDSTRRRQLFEAGCASLETAGWETLVRVVENDQVVGVFAPQHGAAGSALELTVLVCDGRELVIARVQCDEASLVALATTALSRGRAEWVASNTP